MTTKENSSSSSKTSFKKSARKSQPTLTLCHDGKALANTVSNWMEAELLTGFRKLSAIRQEHLLEIVRQMTLSRASLEPPRPSHLRLISRCAGPGT